MRQVKALYVLILTTALVSCASFTAPSDLELAEILKQEGVTDHWQAEIQGRGRNRWTIEVYNQRHQIGTRHCSTRKHTLQVRRIDEDYDVNWRSLGSPESFGGDHMLSFRTCEDSEASDFHQLRGWFNEEELLIFGNDFVDFLDGRIDHESIPVEITGGWLLRRSLAGMSPDDASWIGVYGGTPRDTQRNYYIYGPRMGAGEYLVIRMHYVRRELASIEISREGLIFSI